MTGNPSETGSDIAAADGDASEEELPQGAPTAEELELLERFRALRQQQEMRKSMNRDSVITVRTRESERELIALRAKIAGLPDSTFLRELGLGSQPDLDKLLETINRLAGSAQRSSRLMRAAAEALAAETDDFPRASKALMDEYFESVSDSSSVPGADVVGAFAGELRRKADQLDALVALAKKLGAET